MKKFLLLLCFLSIFILCACGINGAGNPGPVQSMRLLGELEGSTYTNKVVGFSATIPEGWSVAGAVQMSRLFGGSAEYLDKAAALDPESRMYIFFCSKYDLSYAGYNSGIGIEVSNQSPMKLLLSSEQALNDYVEQSRESLEQQFGDAEAKLSYETGVQMGANKYSVIHISANYNGVQLMQDMYILGINDYVLLITETYSDETDKPAADTFIESLAVNLQSE